MPYPAIFKTSSLRTAAPFAALFVLCAAVPAASAEFDVTAFGTSADGQTLDTKPLQAAIDACAEQGGGVVRFPAGTYLTGTLFMRSHVHLHLDAGAVILGSPNVADYPAIINGYPSRTDRYCLRALIRGEGLEDIAITGRGVIDGQGTAFDGNVAEGAEFDALTQQLREAGRYEPNPSFIDRPYIIQFVSCRGVLIEDVRLRNSAMWMQHYLNCDFVTIRGIHVFNHGCRNNDMLDIDCCRNVVVTGCFGDTDDDALTLKSNGPDPAENVVISNCVLSSHCNALKAGTESSGGFRNITITNCVIKPSSVTEPVYGRAEGLAGIALEIVDGGILENVAISNVTIEGTTAPLFLRLGNRARPHMPSAPKPGIGTLRNVSINNIVATGASPIGCAVAGLPGHPIENLSLSNIRLVPTGGADARPIADVPEAEDGYPESIMFGTLPAYGFFFRHVNGLRLNGLSLDHTAPDPRPAVAFDDVTHLRIDGFDAQAGGAPMLLRNTSNALIRGCITPASGELMQLEDGCESIEVRPEE